MKALLGTSALLVVLLAATATLATAQKLFDANFQSTGTGLFRANEVAQEFGAYGNWNSGLDQGRARVVKEGSNKFLRVTYLADKTGGNSAVQFKVPLSEKRENVYMSYRVRFPNGFTWVKGGKIPGLCGGDCNTGGDIPNGYDGWSARLMWREGGKLAQYTYSADMTGNYGTYGWWNSGGQRYLAKGKWYTIENQIVLNTPGKADGIIRGWLNGQFAFKVDNVMFRKTSRLTIDKFYFSTFFGGSGSAWEPQSNQYVDFDDIVVSKQRQHQAAPHDDPAGGPPSPPTPPAAPRGNSGCTSECVTSLSIVGALIVLAVGLAVVTYRRRVVGNANGGAARRAAALDRASELMAAGHDESGDYEAYDDESSARFSEMSEAGPTTQRFRADIDDANATENEARATTA